MLELVYNEETKKWEQKPEPYVTIEVETKEDYDFLQAAVAFYQKHTAKDTNVLTSADRIRAMSDEELSYWVMCPYDDPLCGGEPDGTVFNCMDCTLKWLKQPAEVDDVQ